MLTQYSHQISKSLLAGFVVAVVAHSPLSTPRLGFAVIVWVLFRAPAPWVLGVFAVLIEL